jgi:hypothetical protein
MTHTYALLELSQVAYDEIAAKLRTAGYDHVFDNDEPGATIDMHGIGVEPDPKAETMIIFGVRYSLSLFRHLAFATIGSTFRIVGRKTDVGQTTVDLQSLPDPHPETGWVIDNGRLPPDTRYRFMNEVGLVDWTGDLDQALRFARRIDAENFSKQDEEAWCITKHQWIPKEATPSDEVRTAISNSIAQSKEPNMFLTISKTGTKTDVIEQIQAETTNVPVPHLETAIRKAIAQHVKEFADPGVPVSVTASISVTYGVALDTDGKEIPAHKAHEKHAAAAPATAAQDATAPKAPDDETGAF